MNGRTLFAVAACGLALFLPAAANAAGETIVVEDSSSYQPGALDPVSLGSYQLAYVLCAKLFDYPDVPGPSGFALQPDAAAGLPTVSPDGTTYTFTVRSGWKFSSGEAVDASSFKRAIDRAKTIGAGFVQPFVADVVADTASGSTLTVTLSAPDPGFLARLATPLFCATPSDAPANALGPDTMPTAGPYYVASAAPGEWVLEQNPGYGGPRIRNLGKIVWRYGVDAATAVADVEAGTADYAPHLGTADLDALRSAYGPGSPAAAAGHQQYFENPQAVIWYLALNTTRLTDERLREAINLAIDRSAIAALRPLRTPTDQLLPPGFPGYTDWSLYPTTPDLAAAETLAAQAGVTPATPKDVVLYTFSTSWGPEAASLIQQELAPLGLQVTVDAFTRAEELARTGTLGEPFDISIEGWGADFADPFDFYNLLLGPDIQPTDNLNRSYFVDPNWDQRLADAAATPLGDARNQAYAQLEHDLLAGPAPVAPLFNTTQPELYSARIGCQIYQSLYGTNLNQLCVRVADTVPPGGTVSTGTDATADAPLQTAVTSPTGGSVSIQQGVTVVDSPVHYDLLGQQLLIQAPSATAADPLQLTFTLDASVVGANDPASVVPLRDGVSIQDCSGAAGAADPDPCVASRTLLAGGDLQLVVLSSHASRWNFGVLRNHAPVCAAASASPSVLWPPNGSFSLVTVTGVTDADGDAVTTKATGVTQNEPAGGEPDYRIVDGGVELRAQRDGKGAGRVYTVAFTGTDGFGGSCSGTVTVRVPHDRR